VRYGPNYPDVRKLRRQISDLKAKMEADKPATDAPDPQASTTPRATQNPVLEAELHKLDQDIDDQVKVQAALQKEIQFHVGKLQQVPIFEQQVAGLMRDYDSIQTHYNQLQAKKLDAVMASELETHQAAERFEVLDPAVPPVKPSGPRREMMMMGGLFFGLLCGLGVAFLVEVSDQSVRHEREAAQIFGKPVLAGIPKITSAKEHAFAMWRVITLTAGTAVGAVLFGFVISRFVL
jgi:protein tyrosine kinase modulator